LQITLFEKTPLNIFDTFVHKVNSSPKRTSSPVFSGRQGSLAVEASLVLPLFLFFFLNIISILQLLSCYGRIEAALHQAGRKWALYAYSGGRQENVGGLFAAVLLPGEIEKYIGKDYLEHSPVKGGKGGLKCYLSQLPDEEEFMDLVVHYQVTPVFALPGFQEITLVNRCRIRAWTGYDVEKAAVNLENGSETIVYVAEHGVVYHKSRDCTHLKLSISRTGAAELGRLRNQDGSRYKPCEKCGTQGNKEFYYIADQGDCYHTSLGCSGLKRQVMAVPISQVNGMGACSRCY